MSAPREDANVGVRHGRWGEDVAVEFLRRRGWEIVDRNAHPARRDRRLEIDIIAYDRASDAMVFVEVKQHAGHADGERRLRSVDRRKRENLRRACNAWRLANRWKGAYRFDVIEIYGTPERGLPEIDHAERVNLFQRTDRFVRWDA